MMLFLQILGAIFLSLVLIVLIAYFWLRWKLRSAFRDMGNAIKDLGEAMKGLETLPVRIHVQRATDPEPFDDPAKEQALVQPLLAAGFTDLGCYSVEEMPQAKLRALMNVEEAVYAAVCEMGPAGVWLDLTCKYPDGYAVTYSTSQETGLERPPDKPAVRFPGDDANTLLRKMLAGRRPGPFVPVSADDFPRRIEQAHAEEMEWRVMKGGSSDQEVRAVAARTGEEFDETSLQLAGQMEATRNAILLENVLRARYFDSRGVTGRAEQEALEDKLVFVHDRRTLDDVMDLYLEALDIDAEEGDEDEGAAATPYARAKSTARSIAAGAPPREAFARLNGRLPRDRQFVKVGGITAPLGSDVYEAPWRTSAMTRATRTCSHPPSGTCRAVRRRIHPDARPGLRLH